MHWKLGAKFSLFLILIFLLGSGLKTFALSQHFNHQAEKTIQERAEILLATTQAVRNYTQNHIQPRLADSSEWDNSFVLESVPNFAARTIFSDFQQQAPICKDFSYKEATPNPTNLDDLTDEFEANIFKQLQAMSPDQVERLSGYRTLGGTKLFYLARPLIMTDAKCLVCHGNPRDAPQSLIDRYGDQNGFGWQLNDVIAAQMIYVPADTILDRGHQNLWAVATILLSLFGALFLVINLLLWRTVIRPLKILTRVAKQMSSCSLQEEPHMMAHPSQGLETLTNRRDEPGQLARAFQLMLYVLSQREQDLQLAVQERTLWLEQEMHERQAAQESLQLYSHAISHDLRNLVMGISSVVQGILFQTFGADTEKRQTPEAPAAITVEAAALTLIRKSCDRQLNLMNALMTEESSDIWRVALELQTIHLQNLIADLQKSYKAKLTSSTIHNRIPNDLPPIKADPSQLQRVFENLIENALKFNTDGVDITLEAHVEVSDPPMIRCTVQDNGVGIDSQKINSLFGVYTRGQSDTHITGYGLGLYICRKIIEAHGGTIDVESSADGGATFWFLLELSA